MEKKAKRIDRGYSKHFSDMNKKDLLTLEEKRKGRAYQKNKNIVENLLKIPKKHRPAVFTFLEPAGTKSESGLIVSMDKKSFRLQKDHSSSRTVVYFKDIESIETSSTLDLIADAMMLRKIVERHHTAMDEIIKKIQKVF